MPLSFSATEGAKMREDFQDLKGQSGNTAARAGGGARIEGVRDNDIIDRARELLSSHIDVTNRAAERVRDIMDRIGGPTPPDGPQESPTSIGNSSIAQLFGDLERAASRLNRQLDRFREQSL